VTAEGIGGLISPSFHKKALTGNLLLNRIDSSGGLSLKILLLEEQMLSSNKGLAT
jgi:hypothetical protein